MKKSILAILSAVVITAASLTNPLIQIFTSAENKLIAKWDFTKLNNYSYTNKTGDGHDAVLSSDGNISIGTNNKYWNQFHDLKIEDGKLTQKEINYSNNGVEFVMNFKLTEDLRQGNEYTFETNLSTTNAWVKPCLYYTDKISNSPNWDTNEDVTVPTGAIKLYQATEARSLNNFSVTFTASSDIKKDGWLNLRFKAGSRDTISVISEAKLSLVVKEEPGTYSWDLTKLNDYSYTNKSDGGHDVILSSDENVSIGTNSKYWNQFHDIKIENGKLTQREINYSDNGVEFIMNFKLAEDLQEGVDYTFETDLSTSNAYVKPCLFYTEGKSNSPNWDSNEDVVIPAAAVKLNQFTEAKALKNYTVTFTATSNMKKGGWLNLRYKTGGRDTATSVSSAKIYKPSIVTPVANSWDFAKFEDYDYAYGTGDGHGKIESSDGNISLALNGANYWNKFHDLKIKDGKVTQTDYKKSWGNQIEFIMNFKLTEDLSEGENYTFKTDLKTENDWIKPALYYTENISNGQNGDSNEDVTIPEGTVKLYQSAEARALNNFSVTFTATADMKAGGWLNLRFKTGGRDTVSSISFANLTVEEKESPIADYWDFSQLSDGDYTGSRKALISGDGKITLGTANEYWNQFGTWSVENGVLTQTNTAYASKWVHYVLNLKCDAVLKAGEEYSFISDLNIKYNSSNWPQNFSFSYVSAKDYGERESTNPKDPNALILKKIDGGFGGINGLSVTFTPEKDLEPGYFVIRFMVDYSATTTSISNAYIIKNDPNIPNRISNGDFEKGKIIWSNEDSQFDLDNDSHSGKYSVYSGTGYYKKLSQPVKVKQNTNYALEFWYKGTFTTDRPIWAVSNSNGFDNTEILNSGVLQSTDAWQKKKVVISTGERETVNILFQAVPGAEYRLDDVTLVETDENPEAFVPINKEAEVGAAASGTFYSTTFNIAKEGTNLLVNNGFENDASNEVNDVADFSGAGVSFETDSDNVYEGSRSLKISSIGQKEIYSLPLTVMPNKEYYISFFVKSVPESGWYKDLKTAVPLTFGLASYSTGKFLSGNDNTALKSDEQFFPSVYDGKWHMVSFSFKSNDSGKLNFIIRLNNATAYIDSMYLFEKENAVKYQPDIKNLKDITVTNENPDKLDTNSNLIENFNFESSDISYWSSPRNSVFGDTLNIVDSKHSIQKNTFFYSSNKRYPNRTYYIKWVDVKPNTEYTFSAKYLISKVGDGFLGVIDGYKSNISSASENILYPKFIKKFTFGEENFDEDCNWQNVGISFNTADHNRVGIVVNDKGGEAYIDDIRLFETVNGKILVEPADNFPNKLKPTSAVITVKDEKIYGVSQNTKLSVLISSFNNSNYIRAFAADGAEITDLSKFAATGMELRLMNGPQIKARAHVVIRGDVNGDGLVNNDDKICIIKHLTNEEDIKGDCYLEAADYNGDGKINVYDIMQNSGDPILGECEGILSGPTQFNPGDEINVTLSIKDAEVMAVNGKLRFASGMLEFVSAETNISDWQISVAKSSTEVYFAAFSTDNTANVKGNAIITFKFKVGNISEYADAKVTLTELYAANKISLLNSNPYTWDNTPKETRTTPTEEITTVVDIVKETYTAENRLSMLKLDEAEISPAFDPEIKEYTATVPYKVKKVTVTAIPANENATVEISDTNLEYVGKNIVTIKVFSPEGIQRTYKITIKRLAPQKKTVFSTGIKWWAVTLIIIGGVLAAAAITFVVIIIVKRRKRR